VAALTALIVGAAVGGGVGGSLSHCRKDLKNASTSLSNLPVTTIPLNSTSNSTAAASNTNGLLENVTFPAYTQVDLIKSLCPHLNNEANDITTRRGDKFRFSCGFDIASGFKTQSGDVVADIIGIISYSLSDCLEACSEYTYRHTEWITGKKCTGVAFGFDMKNDTTANHGNCWLKNGTVATGTQLYSNANTVSGWLV